MEENHDTCLKNATHNGKNLPLTSFKLQADDQTQKSKEILFHDVNSRSPSYRRNVQQLREFQGLESLAAISEKNKEISTLRKLIMKAKNIFKSLPQSDEISEWLNQCDETENLNYNIEFFESNNNNAIPNPSVINVDSSHHEQNLAHDDIQNYKNIGRKYIYNFK